MIEYGKCTIGRVVTEEEGSETLYGHIVGFGLNSFNETVVRVMWAGDNSPTLIHPAWIKIVE